jgi:hypothetical protein
MAATNPTRIALENGGTRRKADPLVESFSDRALNAFTQGEAYRVRPDTDL